MKYIFNYFKNIFKYISFVFEDIMFKKGKISDIDTYLIYRLKMNILEPFRMLKYGIKNLISYFNIIWFDRDWDYSYIEDILLFKLKRVRDHITEHKNHVDWEKTVKSLNLAIKILERIKKDNYREKSFKRHEEKYGNIILEKSFNETNGLYYVSKTIRSKCKDDEENRKAESEYLKIHKMAMNDLQKDYDRLFKIMFKYIRTWWD